MPQHGRLRTFGDHAALVGHKFFPQLIAGPFESGLHGSDVHGFADALFFSTYQILTVSSSMKNPLTTAGQVVDVILEIWAVFVVTAVAGSFASFFSSADPG